MALTWILYTFGAVVLYPVGLWLAGHIRKRSLMRENGCKQMPSYPHVDFLFGYDLYREDSRAYERGDFFRVWQDRFRRFGCTYRANAMGRTVIHTMDPRNAQAVLTQSYDTFGVGPLRLPWAEPFLGRGIFTTDGQEWALARAQLKPIFTRSSISDFSVLCKHVERALTLIPRTGDTVDLQPLFKRLFLDISTEFLFGMSTDSLVPGSEKVNAGEFLQAFDNAMRSMRESNNLGVLRFLNRSSEKRDQAYARVHRFVDEYIAKAKSRVRDTHEEGEHATILVDEMLKESQNTQYLRNQLLNVFVGARDTAAIALADVFFQLARLPQVWQRLREEVSSDDRPLTFETLKSMKYLQNVIRESLRLIGPAGLVQRVCLKTSILPYGGGERGEDPVLIQEGDTLMINFHAIQHSAEHWRDPETFRPERWETARPTWEYLPFIGGGRICPAQQLATSQMAYVLATFVREFPRIENRDPCNDFVGQVNMACESRNGVKVAFPV